MIINIRTTAIDQTEALKTYTEEKISSLSKYFDNIIKAEVDIGMRTSHHNKGKIYYAEVNVHVPNKIVRVVKDAEDLYKAIDKVKDHLKVELEKLKGKMRKKDKQQLRDTKEYQPDEY